MELRSIWFFVCPQKKYYCFISKWHNRNNERSSKFIFSCSLNCGYSRNRNIFLSFFT
ncbi:TPA: hypothetical protein DCZ32_02050 [Candidatus Uhrbacteria bacterium]|nr:hypothetical protein [Candidatus Uhrbacteria bacterium]